MFGSEIVVESFDIDGSQFNPLLLADIYGVAGENISLADGTAFQLAIEDPHNPKTPVCECDKYKIALVYLQIQNLANDPTFADKHITYHFTDDRVDILKA